jgi:uncharacterized protein
LAIKFSGEFTSPRTPDEVYDFLCDPNKFAPLLPDFESMSMQDATHFTVKVRVGVGNIRGSAEIKMELAESVRPTRAQYKGKGTAVGSQITIAAGFDLTPVDGSTRIAWQGEAGVFGKLASMAGGMLEPLGKKNIQKLIDGLQWALTWPPAEVVAKEPPGEVSPSAPAEQSAQTPRQEVPSEVSQGPPASVSPESAAEELSGAAAENAAEPVPVPVAEESRGEAAHDVAGTKAGTEAPQTGPDISPQGGTNVAQDVSPG